MNKKKYLETAGWFLATSERRRLLAAAIEKPGEPLSVSKLASNARTSKAMASLFITAMRKKGLASGSKRTTHIKTDESIVRWLKRLQALDELDITALQKLRPKTILLYGSRAEGTQGPQSDVDLCVVLNQPVAEEKIALAQGKLSRACKTEVHVLALDQKKIDDLKRRSPGFFYSLAYKSVLLDGVPLEA